MKSWYTERKQQLDQSLATTIQNGQFVTENKPLAIFLRSWYFWLIQLVPSWKRDVQLGRRKDGLVRYTYSTGMPFIPELNGGLNIPQVYCRSTNGEVHFTDDIIFQPQANGLFRMFVYLQSGVGLLSARKILQKVEEWSGGEIVAGQTPFIIEEYHGREGTEDANVYQLASGEEFAKSPLCNCRPEPAGYDKYLLRDKAKGSFVIVRPDRFIFAACNGEHELRTAVGCMMDVLQGQIFME